MKEKYTICLTGCDDYTEFEMDLTAEEAEIIGRVCELSEKTSTYGCMPTMSITLVEGQ